MKKYLLLLIATVGFAQTNPTAFNKIKVTGSTKLNTANRIVVQDSVTKEYHWKLQSSLILPTNISLGNRTTTTIDIVSSTGTGATIPVVTNSLAGLSSASDKTKLDGLITNATHTGEVTGATVLTITDNVVTNAKLATVPTKTLKGRTSASTGNVEDLTVAQVRSDLSINNVDNTSDTSKPVSTATQTALNSKANLAGGNTFTGVQTITDAGFTLKNDNVSFPRGYVSYQAADYFGGNVFQVYKSRGTNASPTNVNNGDIVSAFGYSAYVGGAYTGDRALFGAVMSSTSGISQIFTVGTTDGNYTPTLLLHHNRKVGIGFLGGNFLSPLTAPSAMLHVKSQGTTTDSALLIQNSSGTNLLDIKDDGTGTFTGVINAPTATAGTNTTQIATTAFVTSAVSTGNSGNVTLTGIQTITGNKTFSGTLKTTGDALLEGFVFIKQVGQATSNNLIAVSGGFDFNNNAGLNFSHSMRKNSYSFGDAGLKANIQNTNITSNRFYELPNESGTIALTSNSIPISATKYNTPTGSNASAGNATLVAGTITVTTTAATANSIIMLTRKTSGGTLGFAITYTTTTGSFTINSDNMLDTSTFSYFIIN